jgi:branched-subunit amino acid aminotransferase/4-amino-4-deoxychorismate lyase
LFPDAERSRAFEGARARDGELFKLTEHTDRLFKSAEILDFEIQRTVEQIDGACKATDVEEGAGIGGVGTAALLPYGGEMRLAD